MTSSVRDLTLDQNQLKQPRALMILFFAEVWERFSYYGIRALLTLFLTSELLFSDEKAYGLYAAYVTLVYTTPIIGGLLADRILGCRRAIIFGSIIISIGHLSMAIAGSDMLYWALAFIIVGTGFFKANIAALLGQFYGEKDPRRESGFTTFYIGINIGVFTAPIVCGWLGHTYGWDWGFGAAGFGMILGAITFIRGIDRLEGKGESPNPELLHKKKFGLTTEHLIYLLSILSVGFFNLMLGEHEIMEIVTPVLGALCVLYLIYIGSKSSATDKKALFTIFVMMIFHASFWAFYEQYGTSLTLFTDRFIDRTVFGYLIPTATFQAMLGFGIIAYGPLVSWIWKSLAIRGKDPSTPIKFALGIFLMSSAFYCLTIGAGNLNENNLIPVGYLLACFTLISFGELAISPVGLSMVTKLSPVKYINAIMGMWYLSIAFAEHIAGIIAKLMAITPGQDTVSVTDSIRVYTDVFDQISIWAIVAGLALILMTPLLKKMAFNRVD